jgi:hypothetical protein
MKIKTLPPIFLLLTLVLAFQKPAYSIPTKWEDTGTNMSDLLNSGWKLTAHGVTRVAANGNGISSGFSEIIYTFTLTNSPDRFMV